MINHVFVYGTLRQGAGANAMMRGSTFVSLAQVKGLLYNLGSFPGFVHGDGVVFGDLYKIKEDQLLVRLDRMEGYNKVSPWLSMYIREEVILLEPQGIQSYIYRWNGRQQKHHQIESGNWL